VDHPEEWTDISPETSISCQRMMPGNNPEVFIQNIPSVFRQSLQNNKKNFLCVGHGCLSIHDTV
jgi:hypothetical protein